MDIAWYLVLSAFIFCIGVAGVLTRRSPLVILICLELMLNAGNLALVAFARMTGTGDGQVFALIVMIVAACRGRDRPRPDRRDVPQPPADGRRRDERAARVTRDHLRLARSRLPARGLDRDRARLAAVLPGRAARLDRLGRDRARVRQRDRRADRAPGPPPEDAAPHLVALGLRRHRGRRT